MGRWRNHVSIDPRADPRADGGADPRAYPFDAAADTDRHYGDAIQDFLYNWLKPPA